jgi:hypothetical protein
LEPDSLGVHEGSLSDLQLEYMVVEEPERTLALCLAARDELRSRNVSCEVLAAVPSGEPETGGPWLPLGWDVVWFSESLLAAGLRRSDPARDDYPYRELRALLTDFFRHRLNCYGLFASRRMALRFDRCVREVSEIAPGTWESVLPEESTILRVFRLQD